MWNLSEELVLRDLGNDFYPLKFKNDENYTKVLHGGPWFTGQHFLIIRRWEPKFCASTAICSQTEIWACLPGLLTEYYDPLLLKKMGEKLGTVLKIDAHADDALRGQYVCICVQVNIDKPLKTLLHISYPS